MSQSGECWSVGIVNVGVLDLPEILALNATVLSHYSNFPISPLFRTISRCKTALASFFLCNSLANPFNR